MRKVVVVSLFSVLAAACGPSSSGTPGADSGPPQGDCTEEGQTRCSGVTWQRCEDGGWRNVEECTFPEVCSQSIGCSQCDPAFPTTCSGNNVVECNDDGTYGETIQTCGFEACSGGACIDPCGQAEANRSYIGCEYWPVDLDNAIEVWGPDDGLCSLFYPGGTVVNMPVCWDGSTTHGSCDYGNDCSASPGTSCSVHAVCVSDAQHSPFAVVVSNPDETQSVSVTLENAVGNTTTIEVAPGAVQAIYPQQSGLPDYSLDYSGVEAKAYKLTSSRPIVAYQFNPLDNVDVFSNDGSLLIPRHAYDLQYYVLTYPTLTRRNQGLGSDTNDYNGYLTVVASEPGTTTVTVSPRAAVRAGLNVPAIPAGGSQEFSLQQFQTLTLQAVADGDLTGSTIVADNPVGVFSGHEAAVINQSPVCCADHLEDQMFPASTWGKIYALGRSQPRSGAGPDLVRVLAQKPNTTVSFNPNVGSCGTLNAGQFCEVWIDANVEVVSNEPIAIAHFLTSNGGTSGDPSIAFAVPTEQFRVTYTLLVPQQYAENYFTIVAPSAGTVSLDGADVTAQLTTFGSGTYKAGRILVQPGQHKLDCPDTCGVEVYGFSEAVSYLFAGGLDLEQIVVE